MQWFNMRQMIVTILFCFIGNVPIIRQEAMAFGELFPDATFICTNPGERCGYSIYAAGDVNHDGFDDFMVAAYHNYLHGWNAGAVYLIAGGLNIQWGFNVDIESAAIAIFRGSQEYDMVGFNVAGKGDFNSDGYDDIIIGAPGNWDRMPQSQGWTYIIFGKKELNWGKDCQLALSADVKLVGENNQDQFGYSNSFVGDVNHDGCDDILCSAPYRSQYKKWDGKVYLILGNSDGWHENDSVAEKAVASFCYPFDEALVGYSVTGVGDVNKDGTPDFVIGVPGANLACLILGRPAVDWGFDFNLENADYKFRGEFECEYAGAQLCPVNDVNHDGYPDFLISSIKSNTDGGRIYLIFGRQNWESRDIWLSHVEASFLSEGGDTHTGFSTSGLIDYDGDGYDDFLIGARYMSYQPLYHSGKFYLVRGKEKGWEHDFYLGNIPDYFWGDDTMSCAGWQVADVGDVNGDKAYDFVTSGPFNSTGAHWGGKIYFFYGKNILHEINGLVKYYSHSEPIAGAKLVITGFSTDNAFTDKDGKYQFSVKPEYDYQVTPGKLFEKGIDDHTISAYDAALVARHVIEIDTLAYYCKIAADVDRDNKVCMYDAAQIARFAVELPLLSSSRVGEFLFDPATRFYEKVGNSITDEDYVGMVLGDVDGSWQITNTSTAKTLATGSILPETITVYNNSEFSIPLTVNNQQGVMSADIRVLYDPFQVEFVDVKNTELSNDFNLVYNVQPQGNLKIAIYTVMPFNIDGEMIRLEFKAIKRKKENSTTVELRSFRINNFMPVSARCSVVIVDQKKAKFSVESSNQPNPFNPSTMIICQNNQAGKGQLVIYDILGKAIRSFDLGLIIPGVHELFWDGKDDNGIELASGVYLVKFICETDICINKVIKLK